MLTTHCHKYAQLHNVLTLQNITEHYTYILEQCLYINALGQNIRGEEGAG